MKNKKLKITKISLKDLNLLSKEEELSKKDIKDIKEYINSKRKIFYEK